MHLIMNAECLLQTHNLCLLLNHRRPIQLSILGSQPRHRMPKNLWWDESRVWGLMKYGSVLVASVWRHYDHCDPGPWIDIYRYLLSRQFGGGRCCDKVRYCSVDQASSWPQGERRRGNSFNCRGSCVKCPGYEGSSNWAVCWKLYFSTN